MSTKHHQVQLLVQKDTLFGTGIGEWYSGGWQEKIPGWEMI